jgi:HPt (histidine-containing phosphotransfer) domain-containing protein
MSNRKPCIDADAIELIRQLQPEGDLQFMNRFLDLFMKTSEKILTDMIAREASVDGLAIADLAHSWKSSAYSVGAMKLGDLCGELESAGNSGSGSYGHLIAEIRDEYVFVREELGTYRVAA